MKCGDGVSLTVAMAMLKALKHTSHTHYSYSFSVSDLAKLPQCNVEHGNELSVWQD